MMNADSALSSGNGRQPFWFATAGFFLGLLGQNLDWLYTDTNGLSTAWIGLKDTLTFALLLFLPVMLLLWNSGRGMFAPVFLVVLLGISAWVGWQAQVMLLGDGKTFCASPTIMSVAFYVLLSTVTGISLTFVQAWQHERPHFPYPRLSACAWENVHTVLLAAAFSLLIFALLMTTAGLFESVLDGEKGLGAENSLTTIIWNNGLLIGMIALGGAIGVILQYPRILLRFQPLIFALYRLLAYLMAVIIIGFALVLMVQWQSFINDKNAVNVFIALAMVSILFINTLVDRGSQHIPVWANILFGVQLLVLPILTVLALYALYLRIEEYGLSPQRMLGLLLGLVLLAYTVTYAVQGLRYRQYWTEGLKAVNPPLAFCVAIVGFLTLTPLLDPQGWSTRNQLSRLETGTVEAKLFDYHALHQTFGKPGMDAIQTLKTWKNHPQYAAITEGIKNTEIASPPDINAVNAKNIKIVPENKNVDMVSFLQTAQSLPWTQAPPPQYCLTVNPPDTECFLVFTDVNHDQRDEAILVTLGQNKIDGKIQYTVDATLMRLDEQGLPIRAKSLANSIPKITREGNGISIEPNPIVMSAEAFSQVRQAVLLGKFTPVMPAMPELNIAGQHLREQ